MVSVTSLRLPQMFRGTNDTESKKMPSETIQVSQKDNFSIDEDNKLVRIDKSLPVNIRARKQINPKKMETIAGIIELLQKGSVDGKDTDFLEDLMKASEKLRSTLSEEELQDAKKRMKEIKECVEKHLEGKSPKQLEKLAASTLAVFAIYFNRAFIANDITSNELGAEMFGALTVIGIITFTALTLYLNYAHSKDMSKKDFGKGIKMIKGGML